MRLRNAVAALAAGAMLAACGGDTPTQPKQSSVHVAMSVKTDGTALRPDSIGQQTIACTFTFTAIASGQGSATWVDGAMHVENGETVGSGDSLVFSAVDMLTIWGNMKIDAGQSETTSLQFVAYLPLSGDLTFRYRDATGDIGTTGAKFSCAPVIPPNVAGPTITAFSVTPPSGTLPVGAPLTVRYDVSAPSGTWETIVETTGACSVRKYFAEHVETSVTHSLSLALPADCHLGEPLRVSVTAVDAIGRTVTQTQASSVMLADLDPPTITVQFVPVATGGSFTAQPQGEYFRGDSVAVMINAGDNYRLSALVWEVTPGVQDSLLLNTPFTYVGVKVPLPLDATGPAQLRFHARDASGHTSAVSTYTIDAAHLHPNVVRPTYTTTISGETRAAVLDTKRGRLYVAEGNEHRIVTLAVPSMTVVGTLALPSTVLDIDLTPGGDSLLVAMYGSTGVGVIDLRAPTPSLSVLPLPVIDPAQGQYGIHVRALANGHALLSVTASAPSGAGLVDVDLATGTGRRRPDAVGDAPGEMLVERSLDGRVAIVEGGFGCLRRYTIDTDTFGSCVTARVYGFQPTMDATGAHVAVGADVYDASMQKLPQTGQSLICPNCVAWGPLSADGQSVFQMLTYGIIRLASADGTIIDRSVLPVVPNIQPRLSMDGTMMVIADRQNTQTRLAVVVVQ